MNSNPKIDINGTKRWYNGKGELHRDGDLPAVEYTDGLSKWYKHGVIHRDGDKPAMEFSDGSKSWWKNDLLHREQDKPAIEYANREQEWYKNGSKLTSQQVKDLKHKWEAIRNGDTDLLAEELLNEL